MYRRYTLKYKVGIVGDSNCQYFPLELLKREGIDPIMLSCSPKRARMLVHGGRLNEIIHETHEEYPDLDAVFIFIGGNDVVPSCTPREILGNILKIAESFEEIGIPQIVMPLMNRTQPKGIPVTNYKHIRNGVNRLMRRHYERNSQKGIVLNMEDLELEPDGVHLTTWGYRRLSHAIKVQLQHCHFHNYH